MQGFLSWIDQTPGAPVEKTRAFEGDRDASAYAARVLLDRLKPPLVPHV